MAASFPADDPSERPPRPRRRFAVSRLDPNVRALGLVSLLTDLSTDMIYPLLPLFLTSVLGVGTVFVGLVEGIAETTASIFKLLSGWYSDRVGRRKPIVVVGYGISSVTRIALAISTAGWHVLLARFVDRVGKGIRSAPRDALIADSTPHTDHGLAFGFHRAMDHLGAVLGPLVASLILLTLAQHPEPTRYRTLFLLATVPAVLSVLALALLVRDRPRPQVELGDSSASLRALVVTPSPLRRFLVANTLFTLGNSSDAFLLLRASELGVPTAALPLLWASLSAIQSLSSIPGGALADRYGRSRLILVGWVLYGIVYFGFANATSVWHVWSLFLMYGVYFGLTEGAAKALVAGFAPVDSRGTAFSLFHATTGLAALPASLLTGFLWSRYGAATAFIVGATCAWLAAAILRWTMPVIKLSDHGQGRP